MYRVVAQGRYCAAAVTVVHGGNGTDCIKQVHVTGLRVGLGKGRDCYRLVILFI